MMKWATIGILATMAFLASGCAARPASHPGDAGTASGNPGGRASGGEPAGPSQGAPGGEKSGEDAPSTLLLGSLIMRAPANWRVTYSDAKGDYTVSTGSCDDDALLGSMGGSRCPSFSMIVGAGATAGPVPTDRTYRRDEPYDPSSGPLGCPAKPGAGWQRLGPSNAYHEGFARVAAGAAYYTVWAFGCGRASSDGSTTASFHFEQRDWYLPGSQILIVDEYSIPGLAGVLADATRR
jgi:hypothetical protein